MRGHQTLEAFAGRAKAMRMGGGIAALVVGGATVVAGVIADAEYDEEYGQFLWIAGGAIGIGGLFTLIWDTPIEAFADEMRLQKPDHLRREWQSRALAAQRARTVGAFVNFGLGVVAGGAAGAIAAGAGDMSRSEAEAWTVALVAASGAFVGGGVAMLMIESEVETGFRAAYGVTPEQQLVSLGVAPLPGGGSVALRGSF
jgi:hypothetical protein